MKTFTWIILFVAAATGARSATLDVVLRETATKNLAIAQARADVEQALGRRLVLRAPGLPVFGIGAVGGAIGGSRAGVSSNQPFGFGTGNFVQPLFNFAVPASRRLGDITLLSAQQQLNIAMTTQLHAARLSFYDALFNRDLTNLIVAQQQRLGATSEAQRSRYGAGIEQRNTAAAAEMATRELDAKIAASRHEHDAALLRIAGATAAERVEVDGTLAYINASFDIEGAAATAIQRRADLRLAQLLVRSSSEEIRIAEANYVPALNAVVSGTYIPVSGVRSGVEDSPRRSDQYVSSEVAAGAAYTWRIADAGLFGGGIEEKRANREANEIVYRRLCENVPRELRRIKNEADALRAKRSALMKAVTVAQENAVAVRENLAAGRASQLEMREAENSALDVQTALLTLAYQQNVARAEWDRATGGYFEFSDEAKTR